VPLPKPVSVQYRISQQASNTKYPESKKRVRPLQDREDVTMEDDSNSHGSNHSSEDADSQSDKKEVNMTDVNR
jgi:hypothetical protein